MTAQETLYLMALTRVPHLNLPNLHLLFRQMGSATAIFEHRRDLRDILPSARTVTLNALADMESQLPRAEEEWNFVQAGGIRCLGLNDEDYPARLCDCPDAPILLYYKGDAPLNARRTLSIVGTRRITDYGKVLCRRFVEELRALCPDVLIVSGLAYGVDIQAHRAALQEGMQTVGVLAHGLDQIYPRMHRDTAVQMVHQGGLLTEFMSHSNADKRNFVQRNRIVAGISDATLVVESAGKGGALITAEIAQSYSRDVFAFPGRIGDPYSEGCNQLIHSCRAGLITCAEDLANAMGWESEPQRKKSLSDGIQQELFPTLSEEEQRIVHALQHVDSRQINVLSVETNIPIGRLTSLLFTLEMQGIVRMLNGGMYRLAR